MNSKANIGVLLVNLGTPDSPTTGDVRSYLSQFLNDPRVIDIPWLARKILVNLIIVPFRASGSAKIYKQLWTKDGSPLLIYGKELRDKVQDTLGDEYKVHLGMRYKNPSLDKVLEEMRKENYKKIIVLPLFPQYASSSTGSALQRVMEIVSKWWVIPEIDFISQYHDNSGFIDAFVARAKQYEISSYEHIVFSFHGLPVRQVDKVYDGDSSLCTDHDCEKEMTRENQYCYKATCFATARAIAEKLHLKESDYTVAFQSRLDNKWLEPFSDKVVEEKAKAGVKRMLMFSPAFVADCLETTIEIGEEYQEIFEAHGGEKIQLVESLNTHPLWVDTLSDMIKDRA